MDALKADLFFFWLVVSKHTLVSDNFLCTLFLHFSVYVGFKYSVFLFVCLSRTLKMCISRWPGGSAGNTGYLGDPSLRLIMKFILPGRFAQLALPSFQKWQRGGC